MALCLVLSFALVACGNENTPDTAVNSPDSVETIESPLPSMSAEIVTQSPNTEKPIETPLPSESTETVTQSPDTEKSNKTPLPSKPTDPVPESPDTEEPVETPPPSEPTEPVPESPDTEEPSETPLPDESAEPVPESPDTEEPIETPLPDESAEPVPESPDTEEPVETPLPDESAEPVIPTFQNVEDFIANSQEEIDQITADLEGSGMELKVVARGNSLAFIYQFQIDLGDTSLLKDALEESLESMSDLFNTMLSSLKQSVSNAESIIVEYLDMDGNVIVSKEYK